MAIATINESAALDTVRDELVYTEARLLADDHAKKHAKAVADLQRRLTDIANGQNDAWRAETVAQAGVDAVDDDLDDLTLAFDNDLLHTVGGNREDARYVRYFPEGSSRVVRLGLASQIEKTQTWAQSIGTEPERPIKAYGERFESLVKRARVALDGRKAAAGARADHRVREILPFIDDVNALRTSLYGALLQDASTRRVNRRWVERFFRKASRSPGAEVVTPTDGGSTPASPATPPLT